VLATTDLHGTIYPLDYYTERPQSRGLAKIATLVRQIRASTPQALLIDCGDTIQGSVLESVYQTVVRTGRPPLELPFQPDQFGHDPMMLAMNYLRYDAMTLGNHEFNFGLKNLARARADAHFPWLSANTVPVPGSPEAPFEPYVVKSAGPVRVAFVGITTPAVPSWEKPENLGGYRFLPGRAALERAVAALRASAEPPDVIVVAAHTGLDRPASPENITADLAAVPGVDAIVFGHSHRELAGERAGDVLLVQPKNGGASLAQLDFTLERAAGGRWKVVDKTSRLIPVRKDTAADAEVLRMARPYHELAERYLATPVAQSPRPLSGTLGRVEDNALVDAIHAVQLH
jgi:2',3'-cyclic-nucleotide 2'-phosphodiesterase/3'-nucleotidase